MVLAIILSVCLGPVGTWYAAGSLWQLMIALLFTGVTVMTLLLIRYATLTPFIVISVIWSVLGVRSYNRRIAKA